MGCFPQRTADVCSANNTRITRVDQVTVLQTKFKIGKENINKIYLFKNILGQGYFSKVKEANKIGDETNKKYAIKIIKKKRIDNKLRDEFLNELSILETIDHPNVIRFFETYEDDSNYYLVMEHLSGGDIFKRIEDKGNIDEEFIARILYKLISAVNYCHSIGVVHRDIKPENILFSDESDQAEIKLIDFGLSKNFNRDYEDVMSSFIGTPYFVAPEVIKRKYNSKCDLWSIGATAYMLFTGEPPFSSKNKQSVLNSIKKENVIYSKEKWGHVSSNAVDFVKRLLNKSYMQRNSAQEALQHKFFKNINKEIHDKKFLDRDILKNLRNFQNPFRFKKLILGALVETLNNDELKKLNETFHAIDINHEGFISLEELKKAFEIADIELTENEINEIITRIDSDKNGKLNYSEFLIASINIQITIDNQRLRKLFSKFDTENIGYISVESLMKAMLRGGREVQNIDEAINIIKEVCRDDKNKISYDEFYKIMTHS